MIDIVRASRDGHEFHEAWTARFALQLLLPANLAGIAVEGLSPSDSKKASQAAIEVADLSLYYGKHHSFEQCDRLKILQFKYSISSQDKDFRAADAKKTIRKFADTERDYIKKHGTEAAQKKITYKLITNRPVLSELQNAIKNLSKSTEPTGNVEKKQAKQIRAAAGFINDDELANFLSRLEIVGTAGSLTEHQNRVTDTIVDWSSTNDALAKARVGDLRQLIRDKAGSKGERNNVLTLMDILAALQIQTEDDLLPAPESFPKIEGVVPRSQLTNVLDLVSALDRPLLIHAAGGVGKTVFLQSIASSLDTSNCVVLFDCFGGGEYRSPSDARHLPDRGLIHIVNLLACRGLCDPILPGSSSPCDLLRTASRRFSQAVATWRRYHSSGNLIILIDAADNAGMEASDRHQPSFPTLLLETFFTEKMPDGLKIVASCRTERRQLAQGSASCTEFELHPFNTDEIRLFLETRIENCTQGQINVAQARSCGNPRVLAHLVGGDRGLLDPSEINKSIELDELISKNITNACALAVKQGYPQKELKAFLAGLAVLSPPIPIDEYAEAHGMTVSAVESFAAGMAPLLDRTSHGIIFRDEPTETLIRKEYSSDTENISKIVERLDSKQDRSIYAAKALPKLLLQLGDEEKLLSLALDDRIPESIKSDVGKRSIRKNRLNAALSISVKKKNYNYIVRLLTELSTVASADNRGVKYLLDNTDLVVASGDTEAIRRLFEAKSLWAGTKHARLTIAHSLSGDNGEALRHAKRAHEWRGWYYQQDMDTRHDYNLEVEDLVGPPFYLASQKRFFDTGYELSGWNEEYTYRVSLRLFELIETSDLLKKQEANLTKEAMRALRYCRSRKRAIYAAGLYQFPNLSDVYTKQIIKKLSTTCKNRKLLQVRDFHHRGITIEDGLIFSSALAVRHELFAQASSILSSISKTRPSFHTFSSDPFYAETITKLIIKSAIEAAIEKREVNLCDLLPDELWVLIEKDEIPSTKEKIIERLKEKLSEKDKPSSDKEENKRRTLSSDEKYRADDLINQKIAPLLELTNLLLKALTEPEGKIQPTQDIIAAWKRLRDSSKSWDSGRTKRFFDDIGMSISLFALKATNAWSKESAISFTEVMNSSEYIWANKIILVVRCLALQPDTQELAGVLGQKAAKLIDSEDYVEQRAELYAGLARALLPASKEEALAYFQRGLKELDAIGAGDNAFVQELLSMTAQLKPDSLNESDVHILSNICELNIPEEGEKFTWAVFGGAFSRVSGLKTVAKLCRWQDRRKAGLRWSLPSLLTGLLRDKKIEAETALSLLKLVDPAETFIWSMASFTEAMVALNPPNISALAEELLEQIELNNPQSPWGEKLLEIENALKDRLDKQSPTLNRIQKLWQAAKQKRIERNNREIRSEYLVDDERKEEMAREEKEREELVARVANDTAPYDIASLSTAIDKLNVAPKASYRLGMSLLKQLADKVNYANRPQFLRNVAELQNLTLFEKEGILSETIEKWSGSSVSLTAVRADLAAKIIEGHTEELAAKDWGFTYELKKIIEISGLPSKEVVALLIDNVTTKGLELEAASWLNMAVILAEEANSESIKLALERLLNSESARLAENVTDGAWREEIQVKEDQAEIAASLIWNMLGSPNTENRWRAAHSVRTLAKFGKWEIIDHLISKMNFDNAGAAFQASEIKFFFLHAKLWLLIVLARIAIDFPTHVWKYKDELTKVATNPDFPHVIMRHFAANALLHCLRALPPTDEPKDLSEKLETINKSPHPRLPEKKEYRGGSFHWKRPDDLPKPEKEFYFEYDFEKYDLTSLGRVFGMPAWEVADIVQRWIHTLDKDAKNMYDTGGREAPYRSNRYGMDSSNHVYGYHLGWHALMLAAGEILAKKPVTDDSYHALPWENWLERNILTRRDGLWLSDGTDPYPLDARSHVLALDKGELVLPTDNKTFVGLIGINTDLSIQEGLFVEGHWKSSDDIDISISSALIPVHLSDSAIKMLLLEKDFHMWLPTLQYSTSEEDEYRNDEHDAGFIPWIVTPSCEPRIDSTDQFSCRTANERPRLSKELTKEFGLIAEDTFNRTWKDAKGTIALRTEAWGSKIGQGEYERNEQAIRLWCSKELLVKVLQKYNQNLVLLLQLRRYEKQKQNFSEFSYSTYIATISKDLKVSLHRGLSS